MGVYTGMGVILVWALLRVNTVFCLHVHMYILICMKELSKEFDDLLVYTQQLKPGISTDE